MRKTITSTTEQSVPEISSTTSEPKYKGVRKRKWGKWVSEIRLPNSRERIWLGSYDSPEKAARAFDAALFCLRGPGAKFNFPENPPSNDITGPGGGGRSGSLSAQEIQAFAARYATEEPTRLTSPDYLRISSAETSTSRSSPSHLMEHCTTTSSSDGIVPVDWSLLNMLDPNEGAAASEFGMFSGLDISMNMTTDELYPPPPATATPISMIDDNEEDQNVFSHSSFLWNF